jgi:Rps23 Pro-64 3,4-dihydroxylase Tpa1-like proline 4-hydroxylase
MQVEAYKSIDPILNRIVFIKTQENISWHKVTPVMSDTIRYSFHDQII